MIELVESPYTWAAIGLLILVVLRVSKVILGLAFAALALLALGHVTNVLPPVLGL